MRVFGAARPRATARVLFAAVIASLVVAVQPASAATLTVNVDNLQGWQFQDSTCGAGNTGQVGFAADPAPNLGVGSVEFQIGTDGDSFQTVRYTGLGGVAVSSIESLSYQTYTQTDTSAGGFAGDQAPYMLLSVDNDADGASDDLLFFEPVYQNGSYGLVGGSTIVTQADPTVGTWQTWDARNGGWWSLNAGTFGPPLVSLDEYLLSNPTATIVNTSSGLGGVRIATGCGGAAWAGYVGNTDGAQYKLTTDAEPTLFDFEPDLVAPEPVNVITPAEGEGFAPGSSVVVSGTAEPNTAISIEEISSSVALATTTAAADGSWSVTLTDLTERRYVLTLTATDSSNNVSEEVNRTFDIDRNVPVITSPAAGALVGSPSTVAGTGKPGAKIQVFEGTQKLAETQANAAGNWQVDVGLATGTHTLRARGGAATGNTSFGAPVTFTVDASKPTVAITTAADTIFLPTDAFEIAGTAADNGSIVRVEVSFYSPLGTRVLTVEATCADCPASSVTWSAAPTDLPPGYYTVQATAFDNAGNKSNPATVKVLKLAP